MPGGRPSKYKPEYCELLIDHMSRGGSYEGFAGHPQVRVSIPTLYVWEQDHPEFLEAKGVAVASARNHWEEIGATNVHSPPGQWSQNTWMFIQRTRFGARDGSEGGKEVKIVTSNPADAEKIENLSKQLAALIAQNAKDKDAKANSDNNSGADTSGASTDSKSDEPNSGLIKEEK